MKPTLRVLLAGPVLLPVSAWGQEVTNLTTGVVYNGADPIADAIAEASSVVVETLQLSADVHDESVAVDKSLTIVGLPGSTWTPSTGFQAIQVDGAVSVTLEGVTITSTAINRRAISLFTAGTTLIVRDCAFDTFTTTNGGALTATDPAAITISDTTFTGSAGDERADNGGAIYATSNAGAPVTLTDVTFDHIEAGDEGGAIFADGVDLTCTRCTFDNTDAAATGGAINASGGSLTVTDSLFCSTEASSGGAIFSDTNATLVANRFVEDDAAVSGAALYADGGTWGITNNHFLGAVGSDAIQGSTGSTLHVTNNLFYENEGFGVFLAGGTIQTQTYNWFSGNGGGTSSDPPDGTNVTFGDPLLVDWAPPGDSNCDNDSYWPTPLDSLLIDGGDPALALSDPDGSRSDIGAFGGPDADPAFHVDADGDTATFFHDCDDLDPDRYPDNPEVCDTIDNDCDDDIDDDDPDGLPADVDVFYPDCDQDGHGTTDGSLQQCFEPPALTCGGPWIAASSGDPNAWTDCDDDNAAVHIGADESCDEGDQNCDGDDDLGATDGNDYYQDNDGDGFGGILEPSCAFSPPPGYVTVGGDCDDDIVTGAFSYPGNPVDICGDFVDADCNGGDGDADDILDWYPDADQDGFGEDTTTPTVDCNDLGATGDYTTVELATDCDDSSATVNPDAPEVCNGVDDDCNSVIDDAVELVTWYEDQDADTYGDPRAPVQSACPPDIDWIAEAGDCDDSTSAIHPGAPEICNRIDDDCDEKLDALDDDAVDVELVWEDWDADGYGACDDGDEDCEPFAVCPDDLTENHAYNNDDCDDANAMVNPSRQEVTNNAWDENCDGQTPSESDDTGTTDKDPGCNCTTSSRPGALTLLGFLLLSIRRRRH